MIIQSRLLELLNLYITKENKIIDEYYCFHDQELDFKIELEKKLKNDINSLLAVDLAKIKKLVNDFLLEEHEKKEIISELKVIVKLLNLNVVNGTSLELSSKQKALIDKFLECLESYIISRKNYSLNCTINIEEVEKNVKMYKKMYNALKNPKGMTFISDVFILEKLFKEFDVSYDEQEDIYEFILKYNKRIFECKSGTGNIKELGLLGKIDLDKLKDVFNKFGYEFDKLPIEIQEYIINRATIINIKDVFKALERNGYKLDIEKDYYLLMSLLTESDKLTIDHVSGLAFSKGLTPEQVLKIGGILIKQTKSKVKSSKAYNRFFVEDVGEVTYKIYGSSLDFEKNVHELSKWGISVKYVYDRCKYVLACSNDVISHNLAVFQEYGFSLKRKVNKICSATWSALMQYNTVDIIDRFIEVHPLGFEYLKNNLSVLRQIDSLDDLVFYKLYYSYKNCGYEEAFLNIINNNVSLLCFQGKVSGLTSLYTSSYANINASNKYEITNTFVPTYSRDYYALIKNKIDREIAASIFDSPYVQHINVYSDSREPLVYNFNGVRISKLKVLRVFDALLEVGVDANDESFLFAVLYNTIISKDDYEKIRKIIKLKG